MQRAPGSAGHTQERALGSGMRGGALEGFKPGPQEEFSPSLHPPLQNQTFPKAAESMAGRVCARSGLDKV